jgi:iron complex outermembrane recepter protein
MANRKVAHAVRVALMTAGAASAGLFGGIAAAQQPIEEIVVTGTRIRDANLIASSPVATIDQDEFKFSGTTRVEDLLNSFPQLSPSFDAFTVNPTTAFATADLRGLGTNRTLVLVNGHRLQPGGIRGQARDLDQIPAALVKRVEVLTGGASAVYGSDAMAGVVNFILDTDFEGVSVSFGASGYQHDNDNKYLRPLMEAGGFDFPDGNRGPDGRAYNIDLALGSSFADGRGHAMAYAVWRKNRELRQGARDYSSCALDGSGRVCGGSSTSPIPTFTMSRSLMDADGNPIVSHSQDEETGEWVPGAQLTRNNQFWQDQSTGAWLDGAAPLYNYAPINHFQRPAERWSLGSSVSYEVNRHFRPYLETMFTNNSTDVQIAESGTFGVNLFNFTCDEVLLGSFCDEKALFGNVTIVDENGEEQVVEAFLDPSRTIGTRVFKRNSEGGPRISSLESSAFRIVAGTEGDITDQWEYNTSFLYGRNHNTEISINDFLFPAVASALLACRDPDLVNDPSCYNAWVPGGVTVEAADLLAGTGLRKAVTQLWVTSAYVTGSTGYALPSAQDEINLVAGVEYRKEEYKVDVDSNWLEGNFLGGGGPRLPIDGAYDVKEIYTEVGVPVFQGGEVLQSLSFDLGYRYSDYSTSGGVNSWKIGFSAQVTDYVRFRGGFNRAIRAPNVTELFADQQIALWSGTDRCAGEEPAFTLAQCANTGVDAGQYGGISGSPAEQYNQFSGGNPDLDPEEADTYTFGFVATPIDNLQISVDYFQIEISDRIGTIGAQTILDFCATTGDPFLCDKVNRSAGGDLWQGSDLATSGFIENLNSNFGDTTARGIDLGAQYRMDLLGGTFSASLVGTYWLEQEWEPLPGVNPDATYDCAGVINVNCQLPEWRHSLRGSFSRDWYTVSARWRYVGGLDYKNLDGTPGTVDHILAERLGGSLGSFSYIDLSGSFDIIDQVNLTVGINNIFDKEPPMVGSTVNPVGNANALPGYDQLGRFMFANVNLRF